jgi:hypothetical protein
MKTIAVLTDFSKGAEHATQFALHMAKKMKADVLLFSTCLVPDVHQPVLAGQADLLQETETALFNYGDRMAEILAGRTFPGAYMPEIRMDPDNTDMVDIMTSLMENPEVCLIVTSSGKENDLANFVLSDACTRLIDWAIVPVLVVPETAPLHNFEKIAFAAQLHEEDINSIAELGTLLESFAAELMVVHLNNKPGNQDIKQAEASLNRDLYKKLNCGGVYFRSIPDTGPHQNWDWLKANKRTDLLAVVQQPREQMTSFFQRGMNPSVTYHLTLPVMILPKKP